MCVIIHQEPQGNITKDLARTLWKENPDGGGFAYINHNPNIVTEKFMNFNEFWRAFETARSTHPNQDFLLHMRIATNGSVILDNVHPFQLDEHTVMAHNGIIAEVLKQLDEEKADMTDTQMFMNEVLCDLKPEWLDNNYMVDMVEDYVGWSRLMFLSTDPKLKHWAYRLGSWDKVAEGLYLSNLHHLDLKSKTGKITYVSTPNINTSDAWESWYQYKAQMENAVVPIALGTSNVTLTTWELDLLIDGLKDERRAMGITHPLVLINDSTGEIECSACLGRISLNTADCNCWDYVCLTCEAMLANCAQTKKCTYDNIEPFDQLSEESQNEIKSSNSDDLPVFPEGSRNTESQVVVRW